MQLAADYVALHPSCPKIGPALYVAPRGPNAVGLGYGYRAVDRAIRAGLIHAVRISRSRYTLTAVAQ